MKVRDEFLDLESKLHAKIPTKQTQLMIICTSHRFSWGSKEMSFSFSLYIISLYLFPSSQSLSPPLLSLLVLSLRKIHALILVCMKRGGLVKKEEKKEQRLLLNAD